MGILFRFVRLQMEWMLGRRAFSLPIIYKYLYIRFFIFIFKGGSAQVGTRSIATIPIGRSMMGITACAAGIHG
ncbi:hypothetical protein DNJ95_17890 [Stutzerimonas kirkiae]|uniref:Uncharacterized protein n=1 Tax=Stutzerimonas kirkiae TaxID=2211392 RepID=A0A4Q9QWJ8_9GAMM|nr:hypothetical protein DNJ96_18070 [Stutzerimonas kirkiae]TBU98505.1 hypothetical protein DNJ95_17890 [Stutzerimonas kirkiae]TBV15420.1 hypothetical protein DNK01_07050 [Stutzerimonas kirkiae]